LTLVQATYLFRRYHSRMLRLVVILLVVLLPLRGWGADRMSVQMAQSAMPVDCPMLVQQAAQTEKSQIPPKSHIGCQTCQLCMALAEHAFSAPDFVAYAQQAPRVTVAVAFTSAELHRQAKPPIL
jgi:hypothetical protein